MLARGHVCSSSTTVACKPPQAAQSSGAIRYRIQRGRRRGRGLNHLALLIHPPSPSPSFPFPLLSSPLSPPFAFPHLRHPFAFLTSALPSIAFPHLCPSLPSLSSLLHSLRFPSLLFALLTYALPSFPFVSLTFLLPSLCFPHLHLPLPKQVLSPVPGGRRHLPPTFAALPRRFAGRRLPHFPHTFWSPGSWCAAACLLSPAVGAGPQLPRSYQPAHPDQAPGRVPSGQLPFHTYVGWWWGGPQLRIALLGSAGGSWRMALAAVGMGVLAGLMTTVAEATL